MKSIKEIKFYEFSFILGLLDKCLDNINELSAVEGLELVNLDEFEKKVKNQDLCETINVYNLGKRINRFLKDEKVLNFDLKYEKTDSNHFPQIRKYIEISDCNYKIILNNNVDILFTAPAENILFKLPFAKYVIDKGTDWFELTASREFQDYFTSCNGPQVTNFKTVKDFNLHSNKSERKAFVEHAEMLHKKKDPVVILSYQFFCDSVSRRSASLFNEMVEKLKVYNFWDQNKKIILKQIFMFDNFKNILVGLGGEESFSVINPSFLEWESNFECFDINASYEKGSLPCINIDFVIRERISGQMHVITIETKFDWKGGKFSGNPEGMLSKKWDFKNLPWSKPLNG